MRKPSPSHLATPGTRTGTLSPSTGTLHLGTWLSNLKTHQTSPFLAGKKIIQSSSFPAEEDNMWEEEGRKELSLEKNPFTLWRAGSQG